MNPQPKHKTGRSPRYLKWLRTQRCCYPMCNRTDNEYMSIVPAHQSVFRKRGTALKPNDFHAVALCAEHHAAEHHLGVKGFWGNIDRKELIVTHLTKYIKEIETK